MNKEMIMKKLAENMRKDRMNTEIIGPEPVRNSRELDTASILSSDLGSEKALMNNGEILRNL